MLLKIIKRLRGFSPGSKELFFNNHLFSFSDCSIEEDHIFHVVSGLKELKDLKNLTLIFKYFFLIYWKLLSTALLCRRCCSSQKKYFSHYICSFPSRLTNARGFWLLYFLWLIRLTGITGLSTRKEKWRASRFIKELGNSLDFISDLYILMESCHWYHSTLENIWSDQSNNQINL